MITQVLHCPYCGEIDIVRHGKSPEGKQRYRCPLTRGIRLRPVQEAYDPASIGATRTDSFFEVPSG
jgi:hypothetical protein